VTYQTLFPKLPIVNLLIIRVSLKCRFSMGRLFVFNGLILVYFVIFTLPIYLLTRLKLNNVSFSLKKGKSEEKKSKHITKYYSFF